MAQEFITSSDINVSATGQYAMFTLTAPVAGQEFVVREAGAMKRGANWTSAPQVSIGTNGPKNNLMGNRNLQTTPAYGRCECEPNLRALPSGSVVHMAVNTAGAVSAGPPRVFGYIIGEWIDLS